MCGNIRAHVIPMEARVPVLSAALLSLENAALASWTPGAVFVLKIKPRTWEAFLLPAAKLFARELRCDNGGWGARPVFAL